MTRRPDLAAALWRTNNQGSAARQFVIGDFRQELQAEAQSLAFLTCRFVEKVHDVSSKTILETAAFIEVKRACRIHFKLGIVAEESAQFTLESERPLPHLRHGERNDPIGHSYSQGWVTGEGARRSTKRRSIAAFASWRTAKYQRRPTNGGSTA